MAKTQLNPGWEIRQGKAFDWDDKNHIKHGVFAPQSYKLPISKRHLISKEIARYCFKGLLTKNSLNIV